MPVAMLAFAIPASLYAQMTAMAKHMAYSSPRPLTAADSVQAAHVINELRQAIAKYQDVAVAEAAGYKMFAPQIKNQPQYHFTKKWNAIRNQFGFDPARPTSLLYKKDAQGKFHLIGAMYTASKARPKRISTSAFRSVSLTGTGT